MFKWGKKLEAFSLGSKEILEKKTMVFTLFIPFNKVFELLVGLIRKRIKSVMKEVTTDNVILYTEKTQC